jgi:hypothetical protein
LRCPTRAAELAVDAAELVAVDPLDPTTGNSAAAGAGFAGGFSLAPKMFDEEPPACGFAGAGLAGGFAAAAAMTDEGASPGIVSMIVTAAARLAQVFVFRVERQPARRALLADLSAHGRTSWKQKE